MDNTQKITIKTKDREASITIPRHVEVDEVLEAFAGILVAMGWHPEVIVLGMQNYIYEHEQE